MRGSGVLAGLKSVHATAEEKAVDALPENDPIKITKILKLRLKGRPVRETEFS